MTEIEGPLGIWPWSILNTIIEATNNNSSDDSMSIKEYNVVRDDNGKIESIDVIKTNG